MRYSSSLVVKAQISAPINHTSTCQQLQRVSILYMACTVQDMNHIAAHKCNKKAQLTQGLRATAPSFQDGRQLPSWILSNR